MEKFKHFLIGFFGIVIPFFLLILFSIIQDRGFDSINTPLSVGFDSFAALIIGSLCTFGAVKNKNSALTIGFITGTLVPLLILFAFLYYC